MLTTVEIPPWNSRELGAGDVDRGAVGVYVV